jgi:putative SOS response-associated peptidase YedK
MPVILTPGDYARWLGEEHDPPRLDATISLRLDADVADFDTSQQA